MRQAKGSRFLFIIVNYELSRKFKVKTNNCPKRLPIDEGPGRISMAYKQGWQAESAEWFRRGISQRWMIKYVTLWLVFVARGARPTPPALSFFLCARVFVCSSPASIYTRRAWSPPNLINNSLCSLFLYNIASSRWASASCVEGTKTTIAVKTTHLLHRGKPTEWTANCPEIRSGITYQWTQKIFKQLTENFKEKVTNYKNWTSVIVI